MDLASDLASAGMALAGLLLVFIGFVTASFDSFDKTAQGSVRAKYQRKGLFALVGFSCSMASSVFALVGAHYKIACLVLTSAVFLALAVIVVTIAAFASVMEIK